jgi:hypothetical protein
VLTIGGIIDTFSSTTLTDTVPDAFSFTDQTDVALSVLINSDSVTINGLGAPSPISVSGGSYRINSGTYTSVPAFINNGDTVKLRHTSSASNVTVTSTILSIGGINGTFNSTTIAASTNGGGGAFGFWLLVALLSAPILCRRKRKSR